MLTSAEGIIASWGAIQLEPLSSSDLAALARGKNPYVGFLVDFRMNAHQSADSGLPVFRLSGGKGFVWVANFGSKDKEGALRFLAADPSQMGHWFNQGQRNQIEKNVAVPAQAVPIPSAEELKIEREKSRQIEAEAAIAEQQRRKAEAEEKATEAQLQIEREKAEKEERERERQHELEKMRETQEIEFRNKIRAAVSFLVPTFGCILLWLVCSAAIKRRSRQSDSGE